MNLPARQLSVVATLAPFLYPSLFALARTQPCAASGSIPRRAQYSTSTPTSQTVTVNDLPESRLNPTPDDYATPKFADKAQLTLYAGRGGNGCVSFSREAYMPDGPPNGGDGGAGGSVWIQAAHGETSLHKLARRRFIRAGRGTSGRGGTGGARGEDIVITVPVGTIVREIERTDPAAEEEMRFNAWRASNKELKKEQRLADEYKARALRDGQEIEAQQEADAQRLEEEAEQLSLDDPQRGKWLLYPGLSKNEMGSELFPTLPRRTRHLHQPPAPIQLDLSSPTPQPILLASGGIGGLGNPHFTSRAHPKPMFATRGDEAVTLKLELELKLLADVGFVGLPNAGKSTLLRALTNSRTRVGNWAFTTLHPNIGTVVLDKYSGRPAARLPTDIAPSSGPADQSEPRTRFTIADIPGLIEGAHLDRGLGIAFLRHVERAGVLAFVIDLSAGNAVKALNALWNEVGLYAQMRDEEDRNRDIDSKVDWSTTTDMEAPINLMNAEAMLSGEPEESPNPALQIAGKPWYVIATKADLPETQQNFVELKAYLDKITAGEVPHPSGVAQGWTKDCEAIPVSAINNQGVDRIVHWTAGLLDK